MSSRQSPNPSATWPAHFDAAPQIVAQAATQLRENEVHLRPMLELERLWHDRNRTPVLWISGTIIVLIALIDWWTKPYVSLGFLYLFPIMFAAAFVPRWVVAAVGVTCAIL